MSPMRIIILLLALAAAGGAAFLVMQMSKPQVLTKTVTKDQLVVEEREVSEVEVLTVTRDFAVGEDRIDLTAFGGLTSFALLADALVSLRPGVSQLVLAEDLRLTIHHASEQPLTADDFLF